MKKAIKFLEKVRNEEEVLDFQMQYSVDYVDAIEAARLAYNEGIEACREKLENSNQGGPLHMMAVIRDLKNLKK